MMIVILSINQSININKSINKYLCKSWVLCQGENHCCTYKHSLACPWPFMISDYFIHIICTLMLPGNVGVQPLNQRGICRMPTIVHINIITASLSIDTTANFNKEGLFIPLPWHSIWVSCRGNDFVTQES